MLPWPLQLRVLGLGFFQDGDVGCLLRQGHPMQQIGVAWVGANVVERWINQDPTEFIVSQLISLLQPFKSRIEPADSEQLWSKYKELAATPGNVAVTRGDLGVLDGISAANRFEAEYEFPTSLTLRWSH